MKKIVVLLLVMVIASLVACGQIDDKSKNQNSSIDFGQIEDEPKDQKLSNVSIEGTWTVDWIKSEGVKFTVKEWNNFENEDVSRFYIIFKEGGLAYVFEDRYWGGDFVTWSKLENGILIDDELAIFEDGRICYSYYGDLLYLKKTSESQVVPEKDLEGVDEDDQDSSSDN